MKKLLQVHGYLSDMQYYENVVATFLTGHFSRAYEMFDSMPKKNKLAFLKAATVGGWKSGLAEHKLANLFDRV